jgi:hypothetical protein
MPTPNIRMMISINCACGNREGGDAIENQTNERMENSTLSLPQTQSSLLTLANRLIVRSMSDVCTENLIRIDCVTESPNVNGDDRALLPLPDPVRLAVQVEEPT